MMSRPTRDGLAWEDGGFELEPRWTREPSVTAIEKVCRQQLNIQGADNCDVSFYSAGAFNKLYLVQTSGNKVLMRVSLPVDPGDKTRGEVATLHWLRRWTSTPVPRVFAFDDSNDNEIGFEWILMELMPGKSAYKQWRGMSMEQKTRLVEKVAEFQGDILSQCKGFRSIGTLRPDAIKDKEEQKEQQEAEYHVKPSKYVSLVFFWGDNYEYDVPRGPFRSSHDWLSSFLSIVILDYKKSLQEAEDEEDREYAQLGVDVSQKLLTLLPKIFPVLQHPPEQTFLWHDDLSLQNILVDDDGSITAVLDWECVSTMPSWVVTQAPKFLNGAPREEEPDRDRYGDASPGENGGHSDEDDEELDNEGKTLLYWVHLMEYEQTQLRKVYAARMQQSHPDWATRVEDCSLKTDFLEAVHRCRGGFHLERISQWVDAVMQGNFPRLAEALQQG
ncbi:phosphotransferase enzyme family-domain-containing protein [Colletotrichum navitas]|uniref:Phosphotransferase enzyme family-domain-containing protein n=1 Tax=Colletotrichum navitas TaxID=681940 RepID=A0AAD8PVF0_9PEZI|nr:phosphotransferase enzyme family-domain-containing protein [Colletotrichum navitas]KAK1584956.1 phosphotransferase enzyme family-domain-containing protein [Colletotrichum navitas]